MMMTLMRSSSSISKQGRSQEFTKAGDKPGVWGTEVQGHGNPREHQRGRDKNWPTVTEGRAPMPLSDYAPVSK